MLLTENIVLRVHEWLDRETEDPDLVPRFKRLWTRPHVLDAAQERRVTRRLVAFRRRTVLGARPGV